MTDGSKIYSIYGRSKSICTKYKNYYKHSLLKTQIWEILNRLEFGSILSFERFVVRGSPIIHHLVCRLPHEEILKPFPRPAQYSMPLSPADSYN